MTSATRSPDRRLYEDESYRHPDRECDVVMKGGVTSGIVYPRAICQLARRFRLRSVGGTSAGAIAAACAAAAELGRDVRGGGFARLAALPDALGEQIGGRPRLGRLFQPTRAAAPLFAVLQAGSRPGRPWTRILRMHAVAVAHGRWSAAAGAIPAVLAALVVFFGGHPSTVLTWIAIAIAAAVGVVLAAVLHLVRVFRRVLPRQMFGVCTGRTVGTGAPPALTDWLHDELQGLAGLDPAGEPLTFAMLRERGIDLQVVTTCLTHGRPYGLPGLRRTLYFDRDELAALFPKPVVDHLVTLGERRVLEDGADPDDPDRALEHACMHPRLPLPRHDELPVLVAVRASLSFPILLSAVPLWDYDWGGDRNHVAAEGGAARDAAPPASQKRRKAWRRWIHEHPDEWQRFLADPRRLPAEAPPPLVPERIWFSDGGISSNFPIHLFDAPLPTRPTIGIDLRYHPEGVELDVGDRVELAQSHADRIDEDWSRLAPTGGDEPGTVLAFVIRVLGSMQNWTDNTLAKVPGFRDRFATIHLQHGEGGLNLEPDPALIGQLAGFGERAGSLLRERFLRTEGQGEELTWTNHRWTRLRTTLAVFEDWVRDFARGLEHEASPSYRALVDREPGTPPTSYELAHEQRPLVDELLDALLAIRRQLAAAAPVDLATKSPRPRPVLRVTPRWSFPEPAQRHDDGCDAGACSLH